jgi:hypothetical protein
MAPLLFHFCSPLSYFEGRKRCLNQDIDLLPDLPGIEFNAPWESLSKRL